MHNLPLSKSTCPLQLSIPAQHDFTNPAVELNPKALNAWLEDLPLLNLEWSLQQILDAIESLNKQRTSEKIRLQLLLSYRKTVLRMYPSVDHANLRLLSLTLAQTESIGHLMGEVCNALAGGFKILVNQAWLAKSNTARERQLFKPCYFAMEALCLSILSAFRSYYEVPSGLFLELHQLAELSRQAGFDRQCISEHDGDAEAKATLHGLYFRILLIATLDPYHLSEDVAVRLYRLLEKLDYQPLLDDPLRPSHEDNPYLFWIDPYQDRAPKKYLASSVSAHATIRIINTQPLVDLCEEKLSHPAHIRAIHREEEDEVQLLALLAQHARTGSTRMLQRTPTKRRALVVFGINQAHAMLSCSRPQLDSLLQGDSFGRSTSEQPCLSLSSLHVVNESTGGLLLRSSECSSMAAKVGDVIGILTQFENQNMVQIATIRWTRKNKKAEVELGVEFFSSKVFAITCHTPGSASHAGDQVNCLYISSNATLNIPATLLSPKKMYSRGKRLEVINNDSKIQVEAKFLFDDTAHFDRFEFDTLS